MVVNEDFCRATRSMRKKLYEYGKDSGQQFTIRYNKLYLNKKCYVYSPATDSICELETNKQRQIDDTSGGSDTVSS